MRRSFLAIGPSVALLLGACGQGATPSWSPTERAQIRSLSLSRLSPPAPDPTNAVADDPAAAALGRELFFDPRLSANGKVSCGTCHDPRLHFTDGLSTSRGVGKVARNAPSLLPAPWSPWLFLDGRADSLWAQAIVPIEHSDELGLGRAALRDLMSSHYAGEYEAVFSVPPRRDEPTRVLVRTGKALAAFVRTLRPQPGRFDRFADALGDGAETRGLLTLEEQRGLKLFLGKGQCLRCHQGPLLTNHGFHNTGLAPLPGRPFDRGRSEGIARALASEFNCRGPHIDAGPLPCPHLEFARGPGPESVGAFRTPSLRNVSATAPYMHDGRFATLREVLQHYNRAPQVARPYGHTELFPLGLTGTEMSDLEAFLASLTAGGGPQ